MLHTTAKCLTPGCPNTSYRLHCPSCLAQEASTRLLQADEGICTHRYSVTGDYEMIKRLVPEYAGGHPQPGYMLDVCKTCLKELQERPYNPGRATRHY